MTNDARGVQQQYIQGGLKSNKHETTHQAFGTLPSFHYTLDVLPEFCVGYAHILSLDGRRTAQARVQSHKPYLLIMLTNGAHLWHNGCMSTRGSIGFRHNGQDYLTYSHGDSYPDSLGIDALELAKALIKEPGLKWVRKMLDEVKVITSDGPAPTADDISALKPYTNTGCGGQSESDWYCLTRGLQGNLKEMLKCGYMLVNNDFIYDSLFCEYAYIINLDDEILEVYKGFNKGRPGEESRYEFDLSKLSEHRRKETMDEQFFPCSIAAKFPFDSLPNDPTSFLRAITPMSDEESEWLERQFDAHFEKSYANTLLANIKHKINTTDTGHLLDELMNAFTAGYALNKYSD